MPRTASASAVAEAQTELLPVAIPPAARHPKVRMITRSEIFPDPEQPREAADAELRNLLAREGMLHPITVRPHPTMTAGWMIVDGERRWRSAEGVLNDLPCIVRTDLDDPAARLALQLTANSGKPLSPLEEARAFGRLLEDTGASVADVAKMLGRAPSTVAERLALLELGPWLPLIESGEIVMSHAVKVLLPLRTVPDDVHAHAIELLRKDYRFEKKGTGAGISLGDFENLIRQFYTPSMYPLTKTKSSWHKQPEFNTSKHDAECGCGGIKFDLGVGGGDGGRLCCGNPAWWRPLDRAAKKAKKAAAPKESAKKGGKTLYLPEGAATVQAQYGNAPKGVLQLTDSRGTWSISFMEAFDPADLVLEPKKLVQWKGYGDYPSVGTKDGAAVAAAQAKWRARFAAEREQLLAGFRVSLEGKREACRVDGPGVLHLRRFLTAVPVAAVDIADALEIPVPAKVRDANDYELARAVGDWSDTLEVSVLAQLLTAVASVNAYELPLPSDLIEQQERKAVEEIRKRTIPWKTKPKAEKKAAPKKSPAKKLAPAPRTTAADFMKPMYPSAALAAVVGAKGMPRVDVTKALWKYIKKHGLQDTKNRRMINADEKLRVLFGGKDAVSMFEMTKLINKHLAGTAEAAALIYTSGKKKAKGKADDVEVPLSKLSPETAEMFDEDAETDEDGDGWPASHDDDDDLWDDAGDEELEEATG